MIIQYVRDQKRCPVAVVVAIDENCLGVAIAANNKPLDRKRLREIALGRAALSSVNRIDGVAYPKVFPERELYVECRKGESSLMNIKDGIQMIVEKVRRRSESHFRPDFAKVVVTDEVV